MFDLFGCDGGAEADEVWSRRVPSVYEELAWKSTEMPHLPKENKHEGSYRQ